MKKRWAAVLVCALAVICAAVFFYQYQHVKIPDMNGVDLYTAKNVLSSKDLIPAVEYIYHSTIPEGQVIRTEPPVDTFAERNSKVTLHVSKGLARYSAANAKISWYNISGKKDVWSFSTPFVDEGILYTECTVRFAVEMEWKDTYNKGRLHGIASTTESFKKYIPIEAKYQKKAWKAGEQQRIIFAIPLEELNDTRPNAVYIQLYTADRTDVNISFHMVWR